MVSCDCTGAVVKLVTSLACLCLCVSCKHAIGAVAHFTLIDCWRHDPQAAEEALLFATSIFQYCIATRCT